MSAAPEEKRQYFLDLGCRDGLPEPDMPGAVIIRVDLDTQQSVPGTHFVQADAARLPFRAESFRGVSCNHSLEHFAGLGESLDEIGRITEPGGTLFVSIPDSRSLTDRVYRWLAHGGGHVNMFESAGGLAALIGSHTGLQHVSTRTLCTSFSFMNRRNVRTKMPGRMALFLWGSEPFLVLLNAVLRVVDRLMGSRASVYGWALKFGGPAAPVDSTTAINVCVRCGRGHPSRWLREVRATFRLGGLLPMYRCPSCRAANVYFRDQDFTELR